MTVRAGVERPHPLTIKELPLDERPREKMKERGAQAMGNSELLAILLRTGAAEESALRLAENLLEREGSLAGLGRATLEEVEQVRGIGEAKAVTLLAAMELGRRVASLAPQDRPAIRTPPETRGPYRPLRQA